MLGAILRGTPVWVFALAGYLAWMGIVRLRPRVTGVRRIGILPVVFVGWGLFGLFRHDGAFAAALADWACGAAGGLLAGYGPRQRLVVDRLRGLVLQPGSALPLVRNLALFGAHYALQVAAAIQPSVREGLMRWDIAVSGLGAGYFIGWAFRFARTYRAAPETSLDRGIDDSAALLLETR